ncbi:MAG: thiamine-phosphate synthase family protein [Methanotrichaceae archaeon]
MKLDDKVEMHGKMAVALEIIESCKEFSAMIPEVRTNLVYASPDAVTRNDVLAIDGRITVVDGMPHAAGKPRFGASSHMARLIIEIRKVDPSIRAGMDFSNDPKLAKWLEVYCKSKGWVFSVIDRRNEPEDIKEAEGASMPWKVKAAIDAAGGRVPKVFYETGAVGKEPVSVLIGKDPIVVAEQVCEIARLYNGER